MKNKLGTLKAADAMIHAVNQLNEERKLDKKEPIDIGIGIHTGEIVAGNIGSSKRIQFTVIGDTVLAIFFYRIFVKNLPQRLISLPLKIYR